MKPIEVYSGKTRSRLQKDSVVPILPHFGVRNGILKIPLDLYLPTLLIMDDTVLNRPGNKLARKIIEVLLLSYDILDSCLPSLVKNSLSQTYEPQLIRVETQLVREQYI